MSFHACRAALPQLHRSVFRDVTALHGVLSYKHPASPLFLHSRPYHSNQLENKATRHAEPFKTFTDYAMTNDLEIIIMHPSDIPLPPPITAPFGYFSETSHIL